MHLGASVFYLAYFVETDTPIAASCRQLPQTVGNYSAISSVPRRLDRSKLPLPEV
jgi:hypothetical protein